MGLTWAAWAPGLAPLVLALRCRHGMGKGGMGMGTGPGVLRWGVVTAPTVQRGRAPCPSGPPVLALLEVEGAQVRAGQGAWPCPWLTTTAGRLGMEGAEVARALPGELSL